jgi:DNA-binding CsgD family transcriptional regulator/tetratricopeptide (TPR) repeat protein
VVTELLERGIFVEQLAGLLDQARLGRGALALLGGEAGVGKTSLVQHFVNGISRLTRVLIGACDPLTTPRALGPLVDIASTLGGPLHDVLESGAERDRAFRLFLAQLQDTRAPESVVVLEDVHWADEATLDLLRFVGRRITSARALVVATYRDDEVGPHHPLRVVLGDLVTAPGVRRMSLQPLSRAAVTTLAHGSKLDAAALYQQTNGNPFFVTEVLASGGTGIPSSVQDAVFARAARLPNAARNVLEAASVLGSTRIEPWLLNEVSGTVPEAVDVCVASGMLRTDDQGLAFRHELAREAVLTSLAPTRRQALHGQALAALRRKGVQPANLARLAEHAEAAQDAAAVLEFARAAGRLAASLAAHREAAAQFSRALRYSQSLASTERAVLLEEYAAEVSIAETPITAIGPRREAVDIWRAAGDRLREGEMLARLAGSYVLAGRNAEAEVASQAALDVLETLSPSPELAFALRSHANIRMLHRDNAEAVEMGKRAIELAERLGAQEVVIGALNTTATALLLMGDESGRAYMQESLALAEAAGLDVHVANAWSNQGTVAGELYEFQRADEYLGKCVAYTAERDMDHARLYVVAWQALSHLYQGRWDAAADAAMEVLARPTVAAISRIMALLAVGRLRARRGDPDVWPVLDEALELSERTQTLQRLGPVRSARAEAAWLAGNASRAAQEARGAWDLAMRHQHPWHIGELGYWRWLAGDLDALELPPAAAEPFALQVAGQGEAAGRLWQARLCPYETARAFAEIGDVEWLREALRTFERLGAQPMVDVVSRRLREHGVRGPRATTRANEAGLTIREAEILALVAEGLGNAAIAERLSLSPKTVDHHVSSVLAKLGVRSRTEAARHYLKARETSAPT